jgi:pyridoxal phosphate enzyme (YggS family)
MSLEANLAAIQQKIGASCARVGRDPASVTLLAVTKGQSPQMVREAADLGLTLFGENRVQEAKAKISLSPSRLHWHMIGHLQTNKARDAVHFFEMIQSVDSVHLATEIDQWAAKAAKTLPILLEVNVAGESTKFGFKPEALLSELERVNALRHIEVHGLMGIAPWTPEPEKVRPVFQKLRGLKEDCERLLGAPLPHLSMGMSGDFEIAIEEGATLIRLGTALFGPRARTPKRG